MGATFNAKENWNNKVIRPKAYLRFTFSTPNSPKNNQPTLIFFFCLQFFIYKTGLSTLVFDIVWYWVLMFDISLLFFFILYQFNYQYLIIYILLLWPIACLVLFLKTFLKHFLSQSGSSWLFAKCLSLKFCFKQTWLIKKWAQNKGLSLTEGLQLQRSSKFDKEIRGDHFTRNGS